jgi:F-type H+-transporting ATPase subunit b
LRSRTSLRCHSLATALAISFALVTPAAAAGDGLVLVPDVPTLVTLIIGFVLLIFPLNALIFRPIFEALDRRDERIAGSRRRATQLQGDAKEILDRYEASVRSVRDESEQFRRARLDEARTRQTEVTKSARAEAGAEVEHSRAELQAALVDARTALRSQTDELAREIAGRVLGRPLS